MLAETKSTHYVERWCTQLNHALISEYHRTSWRERNAIRAWPRYFEITDCG